MKITANRADLGAALTWAAQIVPRRALDPRQAMLRLAADDDRLTIQATDGETWVSTSLACDTLDLAEPVMLPGVRLAQLVEAMGAAVVTLEQRDPGEPVTLTAGRSRYTLHAGAVDWPKWVEPGTHVATVHARELVGAWARVSPMTGDEVTVMDTYCMRLDASGTGDDGRFALRASDSRRAADLALDADVHREQVIMVNPRRVGSLLKGMAGALEVHADLGGTVTFADATHSVTLRQSGRPDLLARVDGLLVPDRDGSAVVTADTAEIIAALRRVMIVAGATNTDGTDAKGTQHVTLTAGDDLLIEATDREGNGSEAVDGKVSGEAAHTVNARYLLDGLTNLGSATVELIIPTRYRPIHLVGTDGDGYRYVTMPIKK